MAQLKAYFLLTATWLLLFFACFGVLRGCGILLTMKPARAKLTYNGFVRERAKINAAIFHKERATMPLILDDRAVFEHEDGNKVYVDLNRWSNREENRLIIWYDPDKPTKVTALGPFTCFGISIASVVTLVWLHW